MNRYLNIFFYFSVTDRENDLQDNDISNLLDNMDPKEMARLEQWFMAKNGLSNGSGAPAPPSGPGAPPPPPPPGPEVRIFWIWLYSKHLLASDFRQSKYQIRA